MAVQWRTPRGAAPWGVGGQVAALDWSRDFLLDADARMHHCTGMTKQTVTLKVTADGFGTRELTVPAKMANFYEKLWKDAGHTVVRV